MIHKTQRQLLFSCWLLIALISHSGNAEGPPRPTPSTPDTKLTQTASASESIPQLSNRSGHPQLLVDGSPFIILGGQALNSSASNLEDIENVYSVLDAMKANTAEIPISWNLLEAEPGKFDFHLVDGAIEKARVHHLHVVFLWFGTTKNGTLSYVPDWIKKNRDEYFRARNAQGEEMSAVSPFCNAALKADQHAFSTLMHHIRKVDGQQHTVILMQVENETGLLATDRDYSMAATRAFEDQVPNEVVNYLRAHENQLRPMLLDAWEKHQFRLKGTWTDLFGDFAPEAFSAWSVARYVDAVAAAGKAEYALPYYVNVALMNTGSVRPGDWPSGGATEHVIDIWKAEAAHVDIIAPDIYRIDFPEVAAIYSRPDNALLIPETGFAPYYAPYVFTALAGLNGIGFSPFGVDRGYNGSNMGIAAKAFEEDYRVLRPLLPLISREQFRNTLFPIVLGMYRHDSVAIPLGDALSAVVHFDEAFKADTHAHREGGLIIKMSADRFVIAGEGFHIEFVELKRSRRGPEYISIEEGTFEGERWIRRRTLNGDEENVTLRPGVPTILLVALNRQNTSK